MALVLANRVQETATASNPPFTALFNLTGAVPGFQDFSIIGNGNTTYYSATDAAGNWEVGIGTYSTTGPQLVRTATFDSSNGGTLVPFSGTVTVFVTYPSNSSVILDTTGNVTALGTISSGTWQGSTVGVAYGGTGVTTSSGANSVMLRDGNQNVAVNRLNQSNTSTVAAGGVTTLTAGSSYIHTLTGTGGQTYRMPDATTLTTGVAFVFNNMATGTITLQNFAAGAIGTIPAGGAGAVFLTGNGTVGGTWDLHSYLPEGVTFGTNAFNLGTSIVSGGTWQGGTIQPAYGGTGLTTFVGANNALYSTAATTLTAGTLPVLAGGTGQTTYTNGQLLIGNTTGNTLTKATLTQGTGITITNGTGSITVSLSNGYGDTLNPYATKTARTFLAAPNASAGVPSFRAILASDVPTLNQNTTGNATTATNVAGGAANRIPYNTAAATTAFIVAPTTSSTFLQWTGSAFAWAAASAAPAGSNTQVQFNNSGAFGASANLTFASNTLTVNGVAVGRGGGSISTNTAVGASTLTANTTGLQNTAVGNLAANAITTQTDVTAIGYNTTVGSAATSVGSLAFSADSSVAVGVLATASNTSTIAVGNSSTASGTSAVALGFVANVQGAGGVGIGVGATVANPATGGIAIGSSSIAGSARTIVIGDSTQSSASGREIRIGAQQDHITGAGTGSGNILIGYQTNTFSNNPSNSIAIGDSITVVESNATYMNKFRINPSTGLVGPAYGLTYDSTTHEVYAVTSGPPPPPTTAWFTYADYSSAFPANLDLPTGWSSTYSGPTDAMTVYGSPDPNPYGPPSPGGGSWANQGFQSIAGYGWLITSPSWSVLSSPINLNTSGVADGFAACWIYGVQDDAAVSYFDVLGTTGNSTFTSAPFYGGFPLFGSAPRYGHAVCFIAGVNVTSSAVMPAGGTLAGSLYDSFWNTTILFIEYDSAAVSNIQSGSIPLYTLPSANSTRNFFWYNFS